MPVLRDLQQIAGGELHRAGIIEGNPGQDATYWRSTAFIDELKRIAPEIQVLDRGIQGHWAVFDQGICLLNPRSTPPAIEVFYFLTHRLEQIALLPREVIPPEGFSTSAIALSPDARSILYVQADQVQSEIMVVENFR